MINKKLIISLLILIVIVSLSILALVPSHYLFSSFKGIVVLAATIILILGSSGAIAFLAIGNIFDNRRD